MVCGWLYLWSRIPSYAVTVHLYLSCFNSWCLVALQRVGFCRELLLLNEISILRNWFSCYWFSWCHYRLSGVELPPVKMMMMSPQVQLATLSTASLKHSALRYHLPVPAHRSSAIPPSVSLTNVGGASFNAWVLRFDHSALLLSFTFNVSLGMIICANILPLINCVLPHFFVSEPLSIKILI